MLRLREPEPLLVPVMLEKKTGAFEQSEVRLGKRKQELYKYVIEPDQREQEQDVR